LQPPVAEGVDGGIPADLDEACEVTGVRLDRRRWLEVGLDITRLWLPGMHMHHAPAHLVTVSLAVPRRWLKGQLGGARPVGAAVGSGHTCRAWQVPRAQRKRF